MSTFPNLRGLSTLLSSLKSGLTCSKLINNLQHNRIIFTNLQKFNSNKKQLDNCKLVRFFFLCSDMSIKYKEPHEAFTVSHLASREDPFKQFQAWFDQAKVTKEIAEPRAFCLATTDKNGTPSARIVIMKEFGPEGLQFFTHYSSRKGKDLEENSKAAVLFYWEVLRRQIRIEGTVHKLPLEEAEKYFKSRPVPIQIGTAASDQSTIVPDRDSIIEKAKELENKYEAVGEIERPPLWGGYLFVPNMFEFWQGQSDRVHDRICFKRNENGWQCFRLAP